MRILVESLKRLYKNKKVTEEQIKERVESGKISETEYEYITGKTYES